MPQNIDNQKLEHLNEYLMCNNGQVSLIWLCKYFFIVYATYVFCKLQGTSVWSGALQAAAKFSCLLARFNSRTLLLY